MDSTKGTQYKGRAIRITAFICLFALLLSSPSQAFGAVSIMRNKSLGDISIVYETDFALGTLSLKATGTEKDIYVQLMNDDIVYGYRVLANRWATIPLNMGDGEYRLSVLVYVTPTKGMPVGNSTFHVNLDNPMAPWLNPSRIVNWTAEMELVEVAASLGSAGEQKAMAKAICAYIAENYSYDHTIDSLPSAYVPDLESITQDKSGICYDFAALYAAMCRSQGIPCRLVMGYTDYIANAYHAWCEVYVEGQWLTVDPTYSIAKGKAAFLDASKTTVLKYY